MYTPAQLLRAEHCAPHCAKLATFPVAKNSPLVASNPVENRLGLHFAFEAKQLVPSNDSSYVKLPSSAIVVVVVVLVAVADAAVDVDVLLSEAAGSAKTFLPDRCGN